MSQLAEGASASRSRPAPGHDTARRGTGLPRLAIATVLALVAALALVFFYAPNDADQGFVQKIFYIHVPLAIVTLCGFLFGAIMAIQHLRTRYPRWDVRSYVAIHLSLVLAVA